MRLLALFMSLFFITTGNAMAGDSAADTQPTKLKLGLELTQLEQSRRAITAAIPFADGHNYLGLSLGSQGFLEAQGDGKNRFKSATDLALLYEGEADTSSGFTWRSGIELGYRWLPKSDQGQSENHVYTSIHQSVGLKLGRIFLFTGVGYRLNFIRPLDPPKLGNTYASDSLVYPRLGFDWAL